MSMKLNVKSDGIEFGTNILKVKVPKQLRNKVRCGVDYIDAALGGGGFTPSAVTFFTGTPGSGKTTMMLKMADSLTKQGAIQFYLAARILSPEIRLTQYVQRSGSGSMFAFDLYCEIVAFRGIANLSVY